VDWLNIIFTAVYALLVVSALGSVLFDNREPHRTIAWLLVIVAVPVLGLVLYAFFGQNLRRAYKARHRKAISESVRWLQENEDVRGRLLRTDLSQFPQRYDSLRLFLKKTCQAAAFRSPEPQIFSDGTDFLDALISDINAAQHHVHVEFFIFDDDGAGNRLAQALAQAAQRGVQTRLIYDDVGCWSVPRRVFRRLSEQGVEVQAYSRVHFRWMTHRVNYRNHRKLCIIDGQTGYIGGMNIADRYLHGQPRGTNWRDLMLRITGEAVYGMQTIFLYDWGTCTKKPLIHPDFYPEIASASAEQTAAMPFYQMASTEPFGNCHNMLLAYNHLIENARERILIQTPYFMPSASLIEALQTAAMRGVHVQIMVPERMGSFWMTRANQSYYQDLLDFGAELYAYTLGMLHAKLLVIDDDFASVGSVNIDHRSLEDTFEDSAFIYSAPVAAELAARFAAEKKNCRYIDLQSWNQRTRRRRFVESLMRIFTPLL